MSLIRTLETLITFPTITGNHKAVHAAYEWIKDELQPVPLYVKELRHNGFESLILTTRRTKSPKLWLAAHIDVVAGSGRVFSPKKRGGKLFGRGAFAPYR